MRVGLFGHFSLVYHFSFLTPSPWETARYRLKYCLKGPLSTNQPTNLISDIKYIILWINIFTLSKDDGPHLTLPMRHFLIMYIFQTRLWYKIFTFDTDQTVIQKIFTIYTRPGCDTTDIDHWYWIRLWYNRYSHLLKDQTVIQQIFTIDTKPDFDTTIIFHWYRTRLWYNMYSHLLLDHSAI